MRLAVLSDIHGNLIALEATLEEIEEEKVDGFIVAGDMVAGSHPVEVVNRLRKLNCWMIRGNNENYIVRFASGEAPNWWHTCRQWAFIRWNYKRIDNDTLDFIQSLPEQMTVNILGTDSIRIVHGSPRNISELIYPDKDITPLNIALEQTSEPVLIFGHTHVPWQIRHDGRLALNSGSVCGTFSGKPGGSYAIMEWKHEHWEVQLRELNYDIKQARRAFIDTGLLEEGGAFAQHFLQDIETGVNSLPVFVAYAYKMAAEAGYPDSPFVPDEIWEKAAISFEKDNKVSQK